MGRRKFWKKKKKVKKAKNNLAEMLAEVGEIKEQAYQLRDQRSRREIDRREENLQMLLKSAETTNQLSTQFENICIEIRKKEKAKARCCGIFSCCPTIYSILTCEFSPCCNETTTQVAMRNENATMNGVRGVNTAIDAKTQNVIEVQAEDGREDSQSTNLPENIEDVSKTSAGQTDKEKQEIPRDVPCSSSQMHRDFETIFLEASIQEKPQLKKKKKKLRLLKKKKTKQNQQHSSDVPCGSSHAHQKVGETYKEKKIPRKDVSASSKAQTPKPLQTIKEVPSSTPGTENV